MSCMVARCRPCCCSFRDLFQFLRSVEHFPGVIRRSLSALKKPESCATQLDSWAARSITKFRFLSPILSFLTRLLCPAASRCICSSSIFTCSWRWRWSASSACRPFSAASASRFCSASFSYCSYLRIPRWSYCWCCPFSVANSLYFFILSSIRFALMARWYGHLGCFEKKIPFFPSPGTFPR